MKNTLIVSLYGGPGARKSSMAADVFAQLKWLNVDCEYVSEVAKDLVWEEHYKIMENQFHIWSEQMRRLIRLNGKVDVIVTDSPILLSIIYDTMRSNNKTFHDLILYEYSKFNNISFFLERGDDYDPNGRTQTFEEAKMIDNHILTLLNKNNIPFEKIVAIQSNAKRIVDDIIKII